jgi:polyketide synthase PksL
MEVQMLSIKSNSSHLIAILQQHAKRTPEKSAYLFLEDGQTESALLTYGELQRQACAIAAYLKRKNLSGQRLLLAYPAGLDFIVAFMGCLYAGVVAVPVNFSKTAAFERSHDLINSIASDADISGILTTSDYIEKLTLCCEPLQQSRNIFILDSEILSRAANTNYQIPKIENSAIAYLQYTSGSTSKPKAAVISHENLLHNVKYLAKTWSYTKSSITLTWAPHSHVYGLICGILTPLYHGTLAILMPASSFVQRPLNWLEAITKYQVTHSGGPNFGYELAAQQITETDTQHLNLKSWKVACNGGEQVQQATLSRFAKKFTPAGFRLKHFCSAYGMSEMTGPIAVGRFGKEPVEFRLSSEDLKINKTLPADDKKPSRTLIGNGRIVDGVEAIIVNPETLTLAAKNEIGEVWLAGKSVAQGYWQQPEETRQIFQATLADAKQLYFRTGDLGFIKDKELCLVGRLKEVIVLYGKKYYPLDLEMSAATALKNMPVTQCRATFGVTIAGEEKAVFVQEIQNDVPPPVTESIIRAIRRAISLEHGIDLHGVVLVKENTLPKTASGKLQRKKCQLLFLENKLEIVSQNLKTATEEQPLLKKVAQPQHLEEDVLQLLATILEIDRHDLNLNNSVSEYGFDSIKIVKLITQLNDIYHLNLTPALIFEYATLGAFINDLTIKNVNSLHPHYTPPKNIKKQVSPISPSPKQKRTATSTNDIAIIGMSGLFPEAENVEIFWENLINGKDAIREIPAARWEWEKYHDQTTGSPSSLKWGGFIPGIEHFDAQFFNISPREAELMDPQQRLFLQTAWKAIEDAGYSTHQLAAIKTGLFVGVFGNDYAELIQKNRISDAYTATGLAHSMLANRVSYLLNLSGPSESIDTACSSSLVAIHHAVSAIQNNECSIAIAGGVNALLTPTAYLTTTKAGMLSMDGRCKTFDKTANGYVRSEGIAAIVLKSLHTALADGDHIYGVIKGTAVNHGGHVSSLTAPNPQAQADVILAACKRAALPVERINYIETHGTGTSLGDPIEINGLKKAFGVQQKKSHCGLGAVKTNIGHMESAAGMAGIIKVVLAMQHQIIPGNLHLNELNPYVELTDSPFYLVNKNQRWEPQKDERGNTLSRCAGISSFGFGGTNAHIILEEAPVPANHTDTASLHLFTLSAKTATALDERIQDLAHWLAKQTQPPALSALSFTLNQGRNHFEKRWACVASSSAELLEALHKAQPPGKNEPFDKITVEAFFKQFTPEKNPVNQRIKLQTIADFYTAGNQIDWEKLYREKPQRLSLPTYPFAKDRHWITIDLSADTIAPRLMTPMPPKSDIQKLLIAQVAALLKINAENINTLVSLTDLGFDSISFKELANNIENTYQIALTPTVFYTYTTIQALSEFLQDTTGTQDLKVTNHTFTQEPIAIIGMQAMLPQSKDIETFWENIAAGKDLIAEIPTARWDSAAYYGNAKNDPTKTNSKWAGLIDDFDMFDASFFNISSREANLMDPQHRLFMEVVWKTIEDAGYDPLTLSGKNIGLFTGVEFNEYLSLMQATKNLFHGHIATGTSHAMLSNRISYFLNLHGPSEVVDTACSSSLVAINRAVHALQQGECNIAIAGGVSLTLDPNTFVITSQLGALSPDGRCKTFDKSANGYVKGEGIAALLLKPLSQAEKDGDHIYGIIKNIAVNHGGKAQSLTAPNAAIQSQLIIKTYAAAGIDPETISYIETHGTGTELGDPIEIDGLKQAFAKLKPESRQKNYCGLGSVKTNIGHLEPASGIAGMIKVLMALRHEKIPGNLHFNTLNPYIDLSDSPFYIMQKTMPWEQAHDAEGNKIPRRAGVSSFGFGGTNAHALIEEYIPVPAKLSPAKPAYLITLSAKDDNGVTQKIRELSNWLKHSAATTHLEALSFTLNIGRSHFDSRCAIIVDSLEELIASLQALSDGNKINNCVMNSTPGINLDGPIYTEIYKIVSDTLKHYATVNPETYREKLFLLGDFYTKHYPVDWNLLHADENHQRVATLPAYPFAKKRYWFDQENLIAPAATPMPVVMSDLQEFTQHYLRNIFAEKLKIAPEKIFTDETYEVYGVDSLLGLEITNRLEEDFGALPKTLLYERNQISDLAKYLQQKFKETLIRLSGNTVTARIIPAASAKPPLPAREAHANQDIAIIGLTGIYPEANDINTLWENLSQGRDCITEIPAERWNYKDYPVTVGGVEKFYKDGGFIPDVDKFDPLFFGISPREAAYMDPQERLFMQSAWATIEDAGYTRENLQATCNNNVGVFAGVTYNFYPLYIAEEWFKGNRLPLDVQQFSVANRISYFLNLNGPSFVVDTACSSSLAAIHLACESINRGECNMAIAGGVNLSLHPSKYHMLGSYSFLSATGRCTSFAAGGEGYVPSEGVGTVLLKPLALAIKDNDRIYGVIKASSMNHGGKTSGYTVPNPNAQAALITATLAKANINPRTISYIEAHGTGTALGDPIEVRGLQEAFEQHTDEKQFCAIGSVKSNIGHLESAAGISQLTKVLLQMRHKKFAPSLHASELNPFIDFAQTPFFVQRELADWQPDPNTPRRAGISSFGAGGTNIHLIVEEYESPAETRAVASDSFLFLLSAVNAERLLEHTRQNLHFMTAEKNHSPQWLHSLCYTSQVGRESMAARLAILASNTNDLIGKLQQYLDNPESKNNIWVNHSAQPSRDSHPDLPTWLAQSNHAALATLWIEGKKIPWEELHQHHAIQKTFLPTYPFAKRRCWIPNSTVMETKPVAEISQPDSTIPTDIADWLYKTEWLKCNAELKKSPLNPEDHWLIFSDHEAGFLLQEELGTTACSYCFSGDEFAAFDNNVYYINPARANDYRELFSRVSAKKNLKGIIYLWSTPVEAQNIKSTSTLLSVFQNLAERAWPNKIRFCLITRNSESLALYQHHLASLTRVFAAENSNYEVLLLDLDQTKALRKEASIIATEMHCFDANDNHIAYRNGNRFVPRLLQHDSSFTRAWHAPETALITGGLGALGVELAKLLIRSGTRNILLTGRTSLPSRQTWSEPQSNLVQEKISRLLALEQLAATIRYVAVDVADKDSMQETILQTEREWKKSITGVFHLAGHATENTTIKTMSPTFIQSAIDVKITGALVLHALFNQTSLTSFVLFSSLAALPNFEMSGLGMEAASNAFLDGLAHYRRSKGLPAQSINWSAWSEIGMSFQYNHAGFLDAVGLSAITTTKALAILQHLLAAEPHHLAVLKPDWKKFFAINPLARKLKYFAFFANQHIPTSDKKITTSALHRDDVITWLLSALAELLDLSIDEIDIAVAFLNYGLDSINGIHFVATINEHYGEVASPMDLYRYTTIHDLAAYIIESCQPEIIAFIENMPDKLTFVDNEEKFMTETAHLTDEQLNNMLEAELMELDNLI